MQECDDICWVGENVDLVQHKGSMNYQLVLEPYLR